MYTLFIIILWTWGLTPVWVNIVGTVIFGLGILKKILKLFGVIDNNDKARRIDYERFI